METEKTAEGDGSLAHNASPGRRPGGRPPAKNCQRFSRAIKSHHVVEANKLMGRITPATHYILCFALDNSADLTRIQLSH